MSYLIKDRRNIQHRVIFQITGFLCIILDLICFAISSPPPILMYSYVYAFVYMCWSVYIKKWGFLNMNFKLTRAIRYMRIMNILISLEDFYSYLLESLVESTKLNKQLYIPQPESPLKHTERKTQTSLDLHEH